MRERDGYEPGVPVPEARMQTRERLPCRFRFSKRYAPITLGRVDLALLDTLSPLGAELR
jgi:hypothetical protein